MIGQNDDMATVAAFDSLTLDHASTVDRVAQELRRAIFEGELESGTPLREVALAGTLGVARSTVREAFGTLVAEGLAERVPHKGVSVTVPREDSVRDVSAARWVLEGAGVLAWADAPESLRARVRERLDGYVNAVRDGASYQDLNERHLAFHVSLVALTESTRLVAMAETLMTELKVALAQVERADRNAHNQAESHSALVALLETDQVGAAHEFLHEHLTTGADEICAALRL